MSALLPPAGGEIVDAGLRIRPWRAEDADAVHRACQDPLIQRWTSVPRPYLPEHAKEFVTSFTESSWMSGSKAPFGVFDAASGELVGSCGLGKIDLAGAEAEIGYWIAPWARGRGHATNSARAVARWALDTLNLTRMNWRAEVGNHGSRLVAERIGIRVEGLLRRGVTRPDSKAADVWIGSLLPGQLREAGAPSDPLATLRVAAFSAPQPRLELSAGGQLAALRAPEQRDIAGIVTACQDPESARWTTVPSPYTAADAEFFVNGYAPDKWLRGEGAVFAIADHDDAYAGSMDLRLVGPRTGDVGYLVAPWARGRGYASAALRAICAWGFDTFGLHRIEWQAYLGNDASRRTAEKAGFSVEGVARAGCLHRDEYLDAWTGAKLSTDPR